jgi:hypothetical protein
MGTSGATTADAPEGLGDAVTALGAAGSAVGGSDFAAATTGVAAVSDGGAGADVEFALIAVADVGEMSPVARFAAAFRPPSRPRMAVAPAIPTAAIMASTSVPAAPRASN